MRSLLVACLAVASLVSVAGEQWAQAAETEAKGRVRLLHAWSLSRNQAVRAETLFRAWASAVERHVPGDIDPPAIEISRWAGEDLDLLLKRALYLFEAREGARRQQHLPSLGRMAALARRGAVLHADIALLVPSSSSRSATYLRSSPTKYYVVTLSDGQEVGGSRAVVHLEVGRAFLSFLALSETGDAEYESLWYGATSATLLASKQYGYAIPHVQVGLEELPRDGQLLFYRGTLHEVSASPAVQRGMDDARMPVGFSSFTESRRVELDRAEELLARALKVSPADAEAHLHHGRVLGQLDRHAEAAAELAAIDGKLTDPLLAYYAALFRGEEEAELGRRAAARDAFERAAALFPHAQSPLLALGRLSRRYGDRAEAIAALRRLFALPADEQKRFDPWWDYHLSHVRDADTLMKELYARVTRAGAP